jgi:5-methylcytosine-specific restriction protein A
MAISPGTACRWPGCPEITKDPSGYCDTHKGQARRRWDKSHEAKRGNSRQRGYDTAWEHFRRWFLQQPGNQYCHRCKQQGRMVLAEVVHHIIPIKERPDLKLVPDNCQPLCFTCHELVHGRR